MNWEKTTIGEHCTVTSSKRFHLSERSTSGVPFYCSKEIIKKASYQEITECDYIREDLYEQIKKQFGVPEAGDLLITTRGTYGVPYIYSVTDRFYFADGNLTWLKDFDKKLLPKFLFYWVKTHEGQGKIDAIAKGTAQKAVPISSIKALEIPLPPIVQQRHIIDILSAYDNLIEKNKKQIKLLEEAAQRLYKEWFVDLRFPGYETTPVVDGVPEGWASTTLENICVLNKQMLSPADISPNIPYIGLEHMPRQDICLCEWGASSEVSSSKFSYQEKDIIFGKIRPYFHKVGFALNSGITSTDTIIMRANKGVWSLLLMTVSSVPFVDYVSKTCKEGSKMPRADWNQMKAYPVLIPDERIREIFESIIILITDKVKILASQNRYSSEARDRLLSKLMRGEIEV